MPPKGKKIASGMDFLDLEAKEDVVLDSDDEFSVSDLECISEISKVSSY